MWYFDGDELSRAKEAGEEQVSTDSFESNAIEAEISRFEARFGASAKRHA